MTRRTALFLALALVVPLALTLGWIIAYEQQWWIFHLAGQTPYGAWTILGLIVAAGAACLWRIDWSWRIRLSLIAVYVPVMLLCLLYEALVASCMLFGNCI